ncbi:MAG: ROK family protein [Janthinobacterium lividum]
MNREISNSYTNFIQIIQAIYFNNILSIIDISKATTISIPTTTKNVQELIQAGYISEKGTGNSNGGRKPAMYSLVQDKAFLIAVAMDQFYTKIGLVNLSGKFISDVVKIELDLENDPAPIDILIDQIQAAILLSGIDKSRFWGVGISMPGFIDIENGINHTFLKSTNQSLQSLISKKLELPVYIDNDSSTIALAELRFGKGITQKEIMVVNIGWGIGLGMIVKGKIFRGFSGFAGELSHIPLFNNNKLCSCGKRGCLETEASLITLEDKATEAVKSEQLTTMKLQNGKVLIDTIIAEAIKGDSLAIKLISECAFHIGRAIAVLIHIMNPQTIVLSGKGIQAGKLWLAPVQQAINEYSISTLSKNTEVVLSELGCNAQLTGSTALVIEHINRNSFQLTNIKNQTLN